MPRSDLRHNARFLHFEVGYAFDAAWSPNLLFQYDRASGDESPSDDGNERFNTLFGDRRFDFGPTGIYGPFQRSNLETPGLRLTFTPNARWQGMLSYRSFRLAAERDAWVGVGLRDPSGQPGRSLGRQLEGSFTWAALPDRLSFEAGFAELRLGRFARQTAGAGFHGDPEVLLRDRHHRFLETERQRRGSPHAASTATGRPGDKTALVWVRYHCLDIAAFCRWTLPDR